MRAKATMVEVEDSVAAKKIQRAAISSFFLALLGLFKPHQPGIAKT